MMKLVVIGGALVWAMWWFAGAVKAPAFQDTVQYQLNDGRVQREVATSDAGQKAYRRIVQTPSTPNDWLGRWHGAKGTWPWWAIGLAPIALAGIYALRSS